MAESVLHLLDCLNPGGTEAQLIGQLRHTDRRRWRPLVGAFHEGGLLLDEVLALDVPVTAFPLRSSLAHPNTVLQLLRIARLCRRERVRMIIAHDYYANLIGLGAARLVGAKLVASRRDLAHWLGPAQRRALGIACRAADRVVANARAIADFDDPALRLNPERLRIVPNGLDLALFDAAAARAPDPPIAALDDPARRARTVTVASNMTLPVKGQGDLIDAAASLAARGQGVELLLLGDGAERPRLIERARILGLGNSVSFLGRRRDVPAILARTALACQPSWIEGFPNSVMEAMAARRPVVVTAVGGLTELVTDGVDGLHVSPHRPDALARTIERALSSPASAAAMGERARETIRARYSFESAARAYDAVCRELSDFDINYPAQ